MEIKHIVWDWNGTLLNDAEACALAVDDIMRVRNLGSITVEVYRKKIDFPVIRLYEESGLDFENESFQGICDEYTSNYLERAKKVSLHSDAVMVLKAFKQKGFDQHIVSASDKGVLLEQVELYGVKNYFDNIFGQENNRADSKVKLALELLERVGSKPEEMLFIGDTVHDYEVAHEAGMNCFLVSNGHCNEIRLRATGAPVYDSLASLLSALKL